MTMRPTWLSFLYGGYLYDASAYGDGGVGDTYLISAVSQPCLSRA
ncbi:hypothetical protein BLA6993_04857 [Burkholderia lata]|nr:hypothetical protein BLA6993_04857 [Burkholderia lata]